MWAYQRHERKGGTEGEEKKWVEGDQETASRSPTGEAWLHYK